MIAWLLGGACNWINGWGKRNSSENTISAEDFPIKELILPSGNNGSRNVIESYFAKHNKALDGKYEFDNYKLIYEFVKMGFGVAFVNTEFYKDKQKKDGYGNTCKKCKYKKKDIDLLKQIKRKELEDEYIGNRFGFLTVLESVKRENCNHILYECLCDCGKTVIKRKTELKTGKATSCGCNGNNILIGKKYGKLTVISNTYHINKRLVVDVLCECGNKKTVLKQSLENGSTLSCGCYNKEWHSGENNQNWKGGITSLSNHLRVIIGEWKKDTIEFYNGKCDITGERSEIVHHLYGLSFIIEEILKDLNIKINKR